MEDKYDNTISGLLRKRAQLLGEMHRFRERLAATTNAIESIDRVLGAFDYTGPLSDRPSGVRNFLVDRHSVSRFILDELRNCNDDFTTREIATKIILLDGLDPMDKKIMHDMINRAGKVLRTLRRHGVVKGDYDAQRIMHWSLAE
jgi:hypothetical protein